MSTRKSENGNIVTKPSKCYRNRIIGVFLAVDRLAGKNFPASFLSNLPFLASFARRKKRPHEVYFFPIFFIPFNFCYDLEILSNNIGRMSSYLILMCDKLINLLTKMC